MLKTKIARMGPEIFKAYDIRGVYGEELDEYTAYKIGRALASFSSAGTIAVGQDMRTSSPSLEDAFIEGIIAEKTNVIRIGRATTPMLYFASWNLPVEAAAIITASHNPARYNGIKFCWKNALPIGQGSGMEQIRDIALSDDAFPSFHARKGVVADDMDLRNKYLLYVARFYRPKMPRIPDNKIKIAVDFGNGMGIVDKDIYGLLYYDLKPIYLYDKFDGSFPNHEANPLKTETLADLQKTVRESRADLGIAYDGDADRIGFVDENGDIVPMDYLIALLGLQVLKKHPGGLILMDLRSSNAVKEALEEAGGRVHRCRVGHSLIKKQMREEGAVFAGELSGHYFFEENSNAEMATLAAIMLLNLMNQTGKKMSELTSPLRRYFHTGEINFEIHDKTEALEKLKRIYRAGKQDYLDGLRVDFRDWWFNVRASNTEPQLRLNLEATTQELMEEKKQEVSAIIKG